MKRFFIIAASALHIMHPGQADAQDRIEAIVVPNEGGPMRVWIHQVSPTGLRYYDTAQTTATSELGMNQFRTVFFPEAPSFREAMQKFYSRDYAEAAKSFASVATEFQVVRRLPNNPSSRAAFFEMECLRLLGEYKKMSEKLGSFNKRSITRENELRQLELNLMWEAVGSEAWDRLESLTNQHAQSRMPTNQRAQVAYCKGLVLRNKGETKAAIDAYNEAMIIDAAASEVVARMAALEILRIHDADPEVQAAREMWERGDLKPSSPDYARLLAVGAVARIFEDFVGAGRQLPDPFKVYLEYKEPDPES